MVSIQLLPSAWVDGDALTDEALVTVDELPVWDFAVDVATVETDPDPCWAACCAAASTDAVGPLTATDTGCPPDDDAASAADT